MQKEAAEIVAALVTGCMFATVEDGKQKTRSSGSSRYIFWSGRPDSNRRSPDPQSGALNR